MLASVLKPVDDTRMLEKIGATLAAEGFEVFIIGYPTTRTQELSGITLLPLPHFNRHSLKRFLISWKIFRKINEVKPEIIIINTPELLFVTVLNRMLYRRRLVYDVLENYYRNIRFTDVYPLVTKHLLASLVRLTEIVLSPFVDRFLFAEKGYARELGFAKNPTVLENKLPKKIAERYASNRGPYYNLLFSGTLAPTTGVFEAIRLTKDLHAINPDYNLTIIGYAALSSVMLEIRKEIATYSFITLIGGDTLVPHADILHEVSKAGTGLIIYSPNPATESSIPTKVYEYIALKLPVIISHTENSIELVRRCNAGIVLQKGISPAMLHEQLSNSSFTFARGENLFWEAEAERLIQALKF